MENVYLCCLYDLGELLVDTINFLAFIKAL